jgi:uncharacterized protein
MKNALILHGTNGKSDHNWFPWLKERLEDDSWKVWVPDLPGANVPNLKRYSKFLLENKDWDFNEESYLIGHSSGAMAILGLLQALPEKTVVDTCILVGAFRDSLGQKDLEEIFEDPFNFEYIKQRAKRIIFIHSDNDPYCPLEHAEYLSQKLGAELIVKKDQAHFSIGTYGEEYKEFPFLLELINKK